MFFRHAGVNVIECLCQCALCDALCLDAARDFFFRLDFAQVADERAHRLHLCHQRRFPLCMIRTGHKSFFKCNRLDAIALAHRIDHRRIRPAHHIHLNARADALFCRFNIAEIRKQIPALLCHHANACRGRKPRHIASVLRTGNQNCVKISLAQGFLNLLQHKKLPRFCF